MLVNLVSKFGLVNPKKKVNFGESKFTSFGASGFNTNAKSAIPVKNCVNITTCVSI